MGLETRVTLRCLTEDLESGWDSVEVQRSIQALRKAANSHSAGQAKDSDLACILRLIPPIGQLGHPLIRQFHASYNSGSDLSKRESISGLRNPHWWKQKSQQWRGASTDHALAGEGIAWLCAGGKRRDGDRKDFYETFLRQINESGPASRLPSSEDDLVHRIDKKILKFDAWKLQLHAGTLGLLWEAEQHSGMQHTFHFPSNVPEAGKEAIASMTLTTDTVESGGETLKEVFLTVSISDPTQVKAVDIAAQIARAALQPDAEEWTSFTSGKGQFLFSALLDSRALVEATVLAETGELPSESTPQNLRLGLRAHYARKHGLVDAQVAGSSVLSLCGYWFVPTADHETVDKCERCAHLHDQIVAV